VSNSPHRSFARITPNDLARLAQIAFDDLPIFADARNIPIDMQTDCG